MYLIMVAAASELPWHGFRSARDLPRSSATLIVLARRGEALPHAACNLVADPRDRGRGRSEAVRPERWKSRAHRRRQALPDLRRTGAGSTQAHDDGCRRDG